VFPVCRSLSRPYAATCYRARVAGRWLALRPGRREAAADAALTRFGARGAAFVTACNPLGRRAPLPLNRRALARLRARVRERGLAFAEGEGQGDDGTWPAEPSLLVFGLRRTMAAALGRRLRQNAIVFVRRGRAAELLALR
jgi:hypothetical protein